MADIEPFGIPFLNPLIQLTVGRRLRNRKMKQIRIPYLVKRLLCVWEKILERNRGSAMDYILDRLPRSDSSIFVDASTTWGIGGYWGRYYFSTSWEKLKDFNPDFTARKELFAALVAVFCFKDMLVDKIVVLYTDNTNARDWLVKRRSSNSVGNDYLMILELMKYKVQCKLSVRWIPSKANRNADILSRGGTPRGLQQKGRKITVNYKILAQYLADPVDAWRRMLMES